MCFDVLLPAVQLFRRSGLSSGILKAAKKYPTDRSPTTRTQLANRFLNAMKAHHAIIAKAAKKYGSVTFDEKTGKVISPDGEVVKALVRPTKRKLSDVLGDDLAQDAKPKRHRPSRSKKAASKGQAL